MLRAKQIVQGKITAWDDMMQGILFCGKDAVYVRHVLPEEIVKAEIVRRMDKGYVGVVREVIKASAHRIKASCPIYERCGSCHLLHVDALGQKQIKEQVLQNLCQEHEKLYLRSCGVIMMQHPYAYRNKMIIGFQRNVKKQIVAGFYEEFSHRIIPYRRCLLHPAVGDAIIQTIVALMEKLRIEPYDEKRRSGILRHVLLRYGMASKQVMVVLVVQQTVFPARKQFVTALLQAHPEITTIVQNVNTRKTSVVLGEQERVVYGTGYIEDTLCGLQFRISSRSFYQINHAQTEILYRKAVELLRLKGKERILDAYCGIGTIGMYAARFAKEVIGVEVNRDAVRDARENARRNHVNNICFICDDAGAFMRRMAQDKERVDVIIMDPPRSGSDARFIRSAAAVRPKKILYISCHPQTQFRDMELFRKLGYQGEEITGLDLFPNTFHVETVVLMSRVEK